MKACAMRSVSWVVALTTGAGFGLCSPGCGVSTASPNTPQVSGRVTYEGKPVTGGSIVFVPSDRSKACWGAGGIQSDGSFSIDPNLSSALLERGRYDIVLRPSSSLWQPRHSRLADLEESGSHQDKQAEVKSTLGIPERFSDLETSGLWVNLERDSNWVEIKLTAQRE